MQRRKFLRNTSTGFLIPTFFPKTISFKDKDGSKENITAFELNEITITELQQLMSSKKYSSHSITGMYLKRIEEMNKKGYALNAVIETNPDALLIAAAMDEERKTGKLRSQMHGIPVLIKDNINTGDKMMTTAGATALIGNYAKEDAFIIKQLRASGAVLLGKTNLSEWANFRSPRSTSGWSSRGGQTKNPYFADRNPSGSSSGSGAAASANFCTVAIGTETDGSIVSPSSVNGIVGIKPTVGLLSRSGIIPISSTQDTAGPMARTVKDAAVLLSVLTGVDNDDAITQNSDGKSLKDYSANLDTNALKGKRLGYEKSFLNGNEQVVNLYKKVLDELKSFGAEMVEIELMTQMIEIGFVELTVLQYEFKEGVNKYLSNANAQVKSLKDVIAFNKQNKATAMPYFQQETLEACEATSGLNNDEYKSALQKTLSSRKIIDDIITSNKLDAICGVTNGLSICTDVINGDYNTGFSFSTPAAVSGYPHITVPMGFIYELPIGLSFMASAYQESTIINLAYAYEQATKKRQAPKFLKSSLPPII